MTRQQPVRNDQTPSLDTLAQLADLQAECARLRESIERSHARNGILEGERPLLWSVVEAAQPLAEQFANRDPERTVEGMPEYCAYLFKNRDLLRLCAAIDSLPSQTGTD